MKLSRRKFVVTGSAAATAAVAFKGGASVSAQDKTEIDWWHISTADAEKAQWQAAADAFVAEHPDVQINITVLENEAFKTKLTTAMQAGDPPDMFQSWGGGALYEYAAAGLVRDITDDLAVDGWGATFVPAALGLYGNGGRNFGVPWQMGMVGFWYNKDHFATAGIETIPATWTEFLAAIEKLKTAGIIPIAVGEKDKWPGHFYWVYQAIREGGKAAFDAAYTRTGAFTDPPFVKAGANLKGLIDVEPFQDGFLGSAYPDASALVANGDAAMELMGQWAPGAQTGNATDGVGLADKLGFFPFPAIDGGAGDPSDVLGGGNGFAFGKDAPDATIDFARYLLSVDVQKQMTATGLTAPPVILGAETAITDPNLLDVSKRLAAAKYVQLYYDQFLPPAVGAVVNDAVQGLFAGTSSPEDVAQQIEDSAAAEITT